MMSDLFFLFGTNFLRALIFAVLLLSLNCAKAAALVKESTALPVAPALKKTKKPLAKMLVKRIERKLLPGVRDKAKNLNSDGWWLLCMLVFGLAAVGSVAGVVAGLLMLNPGLMLWCLGGLLLSVLMFFLCLLFLFARGMPHGSVR